MDSALPLPLPQSPQYARTCLSLGLPVRHCKQDCGGQVNLWWQVQSRMMPLLGRVDLVSRGPVARDGGALTHWLTRWQRWHDGRPLLLNAAGLDASQLRDAGFWPVMTPASLALLPLSDSTGMRAAMAQKWRNRLVRAEGAGLRVTRHDLGADHWLLAAEARQARSKGYRGLPPAFCAAYARANPGQAIVFEARSAGTVVAAALFLRHGQMATWQIGHSTDEGRRLNAMNAVLWHAMVWLADRGHRLLDLGTVNAVDAPGLARFKLGTGAQVQRLSGTWLHMGALAPLARRLPLRLAA